MCPSSGAAQLIPGRIGFCNLRVGRATKDPDPPRTATGDHRSRPSVGIALLLQPLLSPARDDTRAREVLFSRGHGVVCAPIVDKTDLNVFASALQHTIQACW